MKLLYAPASPFVRKVRVMMIESGIDDRVDLVETMTTPVDTPADLIAGNPLGKIPCLLTDDGEGIYDSRVICEYLDATIGDGRMFPADGAARWSALRRQALGDGMMDAGVAARYESFLRPEDRRWDGWYDAQIAKIDRAAAAMAAEVGTLAATVDIGTIACACALGYLDFRFADLGWRDGRAELADWYAGFAERASMAQTAAG